MFEDFLKLTYWKTQNKMRKIRELINRISTDMDIVLPSLDNIKNKIDRLEYKKESSYPRTYNRYEEEQAEEERELPDLIVTNITPTIHTKYIDFAITVKNQGTIIAEACKLKVEIPKTQEVLLDIPELEPEETVTLYHQYSFDPSSTELETKTIRAVADYTDINKESNEENNILITTFETKTSYIPPIGKGYLIVHLHNPEGKEVGSISPVDMSLSHGIKPVNEYSHGVPTAYNPGNYTVIASYNGITLTKDITIIDGETLEIFFVFPRTVSTMNWDFNQSYSNNLNLSSYMNAIRYHTSEANPIPLERSIYIENNDDSGVGKFNDSVNIKLTKNVFSVVVEMNWDVYYTPQPLPFWLNRIDLNMPFFEDPVTIGTYSYSTTKFNKWIIQRVGDYYPTVVLYANEGYWDLRISSFTLIPANISNGEIKLLYFSDRFSGGSPLNKVGSKITSYGQDWYDFKIASIPYDILGTAV